MKNIKILHLCQDILDVEYEIFADCSCKEGIILGPRTKEGRVLTDPKMMYGRVMHRVTKGKVKTK